MNYVRLFIGTAICLGLLACSGPVDQVKAFIDLKDETLLEMGKRVEANPTAAGMDEARKAFEERKPRLIAMRDSPELRSSNVAKYGKLTVMLAESDVSNNKVLDAIQRMGNYDKEKEEKFHALWKDFKEAVKRP